MNSRPYGGKVFVSNNGKGKKIARVSCVLPDAIELEIKAMKGGRSTFVWLDEDYFCGDSCGWQWDKQIVWPEKAAAK